MDAADPAAPTIHETCQFWMLWTKTGKLPKRTHNTKEAALAEAERLARNVPGRKFIVLEATDKVHVRHPDEAPPEADRFALARTLA